MAANAARDRRGASPACVKLTCRFESLVKQGMALRHRPIECEDEEELIRNALMAQACSILKSKLPVVLRMPTRQQPFA